MRWEHDFSSLLTLKVVCNLKRWFFIFRNSKDPCGHSGRSMSPTSVEHTWSVPGRDGQSSLLCCLYHLPTWSPLASSNLIWVEMVCWIKMGLSSCSECLFCQYLINIGPLPLRVTTSSTESSPEIKTGPPWVDLLLEQLLAFTNNCYELFQGGEKTSEPGVPNLLLLPVLAGLMLPGKTV